MARKGRKQTEATKRKISEAQIRNFQERKPPPPLEEKPCSKCRVVKPLAEFPRRTERHKSVITKGFDSWCKQCHRKRMKERERRVKAEGRTSEIRETQRQWRQRNRERVLQRKRENEAARRRKQGKPPAPRKRKGPASRTEGLPITPIREFIEYEISTGRGITTIEAATGVDHRKLSGILREEYPRVTLDLIDRILVGLGCPEELHFLYPVEEEQITGYTYVEEAA